MKNLLLPLALAQAISADTLPQNLASWHTEGSGRYARIYETTEDESAGNAVTTWSRGAGVQDLPTYGGVNEVSYNDNWIYVRTTGLGTHIMGPWYRDAAKANLFPNYPANQSIIYRIPRDPGEVPTNKTLTGLGRVGLFVDGVSMFDSRDAFSYDTSAGTDDTPTNNTTQGDGIWNRDAFINEGITFDAAGAHQANSNYHYHANPPALRHQLGDSVDYDSSSNTYTENFNGEHSPILAWVNDGYPLYGPYGYTDANDPTSAVTRMRSGFQKRSITVRQSLPAYAARDQGRAPTLATNQYGPPVSATYILGHYLEDYEYLGDLGQTQGADFDLDEHNGRFCVTPEFPNGTYAYFVSIEADGTPKFPYNIGRKYYGSPTAGVTNNLPADATIAIEAGPEKPLDNGTFTNGENDEITLTWSAIEGGTYVTEASSDLSGWDTISAVLDQDQLTVSETSPPERKFYRTSLLSIDPFDDEGFDVQTQPPAQNNILLIIVDDWGYDSSPLDNPAAFTTDIMPNYAGLASQGVRFTNAYAQPSCSPTRAGIMTGRYSFRHGIGSPAGATLPEAELTLPEAFAAASSPYQLSSIGKWHLGGGETGPNILGGWPDFRGSLNSGVESYYDWSKTINGVTTPNVTTYATTDQVNDALSFISNAGEQPWMCWLALNAPHSPIEEPPTELGPYLTTGNRNPDIYLRMLEAMDSELGRLTAGIDLSKTNIIIIGDNGTPGNVAQAPVTATTAKNSLYEGGIRVPMIALGPDVRVRGTSDALVQCTDLYATILELAGITPGAVLPTDTVLDSRSLFGVFNGDENLEGGVVLEDFGMTADDPGRALRIGDYKLILYDDGREELYNVATDIAEASELIGAGLNATEQTAYDVLIARNAELDADTGGTTATGILSLSTTAGNAGNTIVVTFNLDPDVTPAVPGTMQTVNQVTIGTAQGTNVSRIGRYVVEATFTLPNTPGIYDAEIIFNGGQMRTFGLQDAFTVE